MSSPSRTGTNTSSQLVDLHRVHAGDVRVSYGRYREQPLFLHWQEYSRAINEQWAFVPIPDRLTLTSQFLSDPVQIQSHERESAIAPGDSGGGLFLPGQTGDPVLAGILVGSGFDYLQSSDGKQGRIYAVHLMVAVKDNLDFIRSVQEDEEGADITRAVEQPVPKQRLETKEEPARGTAAEAMPERKETGAPAQRPAPVWENRIYRFPDEDPRS